MRRSLSASDSYVVWFDGADDTCKYHDLRIGIDKLFLKTWDYVVSIASGSISLYVTWNTLHGTHRTNANTIQ